jgi:MFS superfamily sulfate permease-like transporter
MKIKSYEFNLRELAGSMGDFGTLLPLAIGYLYACGLNPAGFLVMMGLANIVTGLVYRLPMPIEPMKVLAVVAISQHWSPSMVHASAFAMGIVWVLFAVTGLIGRLAQITPQPVIRGIQAALGILLAVEAFKLLSSGWVLGAVAVVIVLALRESRYAPAAVVLVTLGLTMIALEGRFAGIAPPAFTLPPLTVFSLDEVWESLVLAGFAQIPLTVTNATIATAALIRSYWPERPVTERQLSWNQGVMNLVVPFFGGMPMCHGAGGLAGQYYFGARTGGANIIEGILEIAMGLFLAASIAGVFSVFPAPIVGAMMLMVGIELTRFARRIRPGRDLIALAVTVAVSVLANMAWGYLAGMVAHRLAGSAAGGKS